MFMIIRLNLDLHSATQKMSLGSFLVEGTPFLTSLVSNALGLVLGACMLHLVKGSNMWWSCQSTVVLMVFWLVMFLAVVHWGSFLAVVHWGSFQRCWSS